MKHKMVLVLAPTRKGKTMFPIAPREYKKYIKKLLAQANDNKTKIVLAETRTGMSKVKIIDFPDETN